MATGSQTIAEESRKNFSNTRGISALHNGDHLTAEEFERRYRAMPFLKKAELIDGRVYIPSPDFWPLEGIDPKMASPVFLNGHSNPHFNAVGWLWLYCGSTPGLTGGDNGTIRLDLNNVPQPDAFLMILPSHGGQARISDDDYVVGAPELVVEISRSTVSYDLHEKLHSYRRNQVQEYVVWRVEDSAVDWFILDGELYERLSLSADGRYHSMVFPGLWIDPAELVRRDIPAMTRTLQEGLASPEHAAFVAKLQETAAKTPPPIAQEPRP